MFPRLPHILGHEPAGVVAAVGSHVSTFAPGTRVAPHLFVASRECFHTRSGDHAQASHLKGILGVSIPGGFAEYFIAPAANLLRLPDAVPFDIGGLVSCAAITAVHAWRRSGLIRGESAVVIGAGGIGTLLIQLARQHGVRVAAIVRSDAEAEHARRHGASRAALFESATAATESRAIAGDDRDGVDAVFETVGRSATMAMAADCARRGGAIVVIGEEPEHPAIDTIAIAQRELRIIGSRNGGRQDAADALALMASRALRPPIQAHFPLSRINEAFALARSGQGSGRICITFPA